MTTLSLNIDKEENKKTSRSSKLILIFVLTLLAAISLILYPEVIVKILTAIYSKAVAASNSYHINFTIILVVFLVCEVLFNAGWILMLKGSGVAKIRLSDLRKRNLKKIDLKNRSVRIGFLLNLLGASASWIYLLTIVLIKFPWGLKAVSIAPILWEIFVVLSIRFPIAVAIFLGKQTLNEAGETS